MENTTVLIKRRWASHPSNVQPARQLVRAVAKRYLSDCIDLIEIAIGEACANAIEHGSPRGSLSHFTLFCFDHKKNALVFQVVDEGQAACLDRGDPNEVPDLVSEGGRGLFLITQIMDEVVFENGPNGSVLHMIKWYEAPSKQHLTNRSPKYDIIENHGGTRSWISGEAANPANEARLLPVSGFRGRDHLCR